ncbi:Rossmann-like domain-containing protein [Actinoalloteichus hymeniacidonis]|uniref:DUF364 family protein n=1 Tax=Actinoalloteichus hymeniacidonis TaxID=340345 RepID=A0AAC9MZ10_9PSEU|nr:DUF364 domain-containing protein [Actinoalloteichus hymeniacidonis]AOS63572.1 putative DUF364 family protein [Actinoalloteichus hymeniacidonis]MBB5908382.1 hypothetical protein [Actinoalloteichus hymeniacidonis]
MTGRVTTLGELTDSVLAGEMGPPPSALTATSGFWLRHATRLAGSPTTYLNHYVVLRCGAAFGASSFEPGEVDSDFCEGVAGRTLDTLISDGRPAVRTAALDAYLGAVRPHRSSEAAVSTTLPSGSPESRAAARDAAVAGLLEIKPGSRVALIGVVNPLVAAIRERGGVPLPCDFNLAATAWGDPVVASMATVLAEADAVVATGMTLGNGTFDALLSTCRERGVPLVVYAQTGSAVAREFLGAGVTALSAEPFPFSQFSAEPTELYLYRA